MQEYVNRFQPLFNTTQTNGFVSGAAAKNVLTSTGLAVGQLRKIWELADIDKDGQLDLQEFTIAMYLSDQVKAGREVPARLDEDMVPPNKRR
jgi:EH domain-containing protein 1